MAISILNDSSKNLQNELNILLSASNPATIGDIRKIYAEHLAIPPYSDLVRAKEILEVDISKPIFKDYSFHGDELPQKNTMLEITADALIDIGSIDAEIMQTTNKYLKLLTGTVSRLNDIKHRLSISKEKIKDINFLNSSYQGLNYSIPITSETMTGGFCFTQDTFSAFAQDYRAVDLEILTISGNGYSGNKYVLDDNGEYLTNSDLRNNSNFLIDNNPTTIYEYSRLCNLSSSMLNITDVNNDNKDVSCTITIQSSKQNINVLRINSNICSEYIKVTDLLVSLDGINYTRAFNGITTFKNGYAIISFPESQFIKITITSAYYVPNEKLGYDYVDASDNLNLKIKPLENVIRKVIPLLDIEGYAASYQKSVMITDNLAPVIDIENYIAGCNSVSIFSNEYIPDVDVNKDDIIKYELIINEKEYVVTPINSLKSGIKLITFSQDKYMSPNVVFLDEKITTLQLRVTIDPLNTSQTTFINNLKVFIG